MFGRGQSVASGPPAGSHFSHRLRLDRVPGCNLVRLNDGFQHAMPSALSAPTGIDRKTR